jgi:hypothetical protein
MKKIRVLFIVNCLFLILLFYELSNTFAVFESDASGEVSSNLAKWKVLVNDVNIVSSNSFNMADIAWDTSLLVSSNKGAPGLGGEFDIIISALDTEVSFRYDIVFDFSSLEGENFGVDSIVDLNNSDIVMTDKDVYSGIFTLDDIDSGKIADINVHLTWENNEDNNNVDYDIGSVYDSSVTIPVSVHIIQYSGEELVPYIES